MAKRSVKADASLIATPHPVARPQHARIPQEFPGITKTCDNCQHFDPKVEGGRSGDCHNGISGRLQTLRINGCAYGFWPSAAKFPLKAGPGGVR